MSKQSDAKADQNYREKPVWRECRNCRHFSLDRVPQKSEYTDSEWIDEKNLRCTLGNFAVKKLATCDKHERMP